MVFCFFVEKCDFIPSNAEIPVDIRGVAGNPRQDPTPQRSHSHLIPTTQNINKRRNESIAIPNGDNLLRQNLCEREDFLINCFYTHIRFLH